MADALAHRGPDDRGIWIGAGGKMGPIVLCHRRLSIIDLSEEGRQPMLSGDERYVISYNGEVYNFRQLRSELAAHGHMFRGHSDTEVILAAIVQWGLRSALCRFLGMFAFALWDRQQRVLHLARDRLGIKPLYYGRACKGFVFASELKAICAHPDFSPEVDRKALALYLRHLYIPTPNSVYRDVCKLPPGSILSLQSEKPGSQPQISDYWSLKGAVERGAMNPFIGTEQEAANAVEELLSDAVRLKMVADVPVGALLSGGVDSSTVVAIMQAESNKPVRTFTIGFREGEHNEAERARAIANHFGTDHTELYVHAEEALNVIPDLPRLYDEPFADSSQIPTFLISQLAREQVTVGLSGDGGDELFGGYDRYFLVPRLWDKTSHFPLVARRLLAQLCTAGSIGFWNQILQKIGRTFPSKVSTRWRAQQLQTLGRLLSAESQADMYRDIVSLWSSPSAVVIDGMEPTTGLTQVDTWPELDEASLLMMYLDAVSYLPDDILTKVDRASMGVSLEVRVPLLDHRLVEFVWSLPVSMRATSDGRKSLLRDILNRHIPKHLVDYPKHGFTVPVDEWLRGPMRSWAEELLEPERIRTESFFRPEPIRKVWNEHLNEGQNWGHHLWAILMFQAWLTYGPASMH